MCYLNCAVSFVLLAKAVLSLSTECEALRLLGTSLSGMNAGTQLQIVIGLLSCGTLRGAVVNSNSVLAHPIGSSGLAILAIGTARLELFTESTRAQLL